MSERKALIALRDDVVAGKWGPETQALRSPPSTFKTPFAPEPMDKRRRQAWSAYHGSVDAAIALIEAVLPENDHAIELTYRPFGVRPHLYRVTLTTDHTGWGNGKYYKGESETAARALLIAILHALTAKTKQ